MSKSSLSVRAQSSTESTQDAYFQNSGPLAPGPGRPKQHSNLVDLGGSEGPSVRSSRGGYYTAVGPARSRQYSNSAESLDGARGSRELVPYGGGPGVGVRPKHSSSADSLLEGPTRPSRERDGRAAGSLGKSASLPQNSMVLSKAGGHDDGRGGRKLRPSIAVQVRGNADENALPPPSCRGNHELFAGGQLRDSVGLRRRGQSSHGGPLHRGPGGR